MSVFRLGTKSVHIESARIVPIFGDDDEGEELDIMWGVEVVGFCKDIDQRCRLVSAELFTSQKNEVTTYFDLEGFHGRWKGVGSENGDPRAQLSIWEHGDVTDVSWRLAIGEKGQLRLFFEGETWIDCAPHFDGESAISISADLSWDGVPCGRMTESECRSQQTDLGLHEEMEFAVVDGVSYLKPLGYPRAKKR